MLPFQSIAGRRIIDSIQFLQALSWEFHYNTVALDLYTEVLTWESHSYNGVGNSFQLNDIGTSMYENRKGLH